MFGIYISILCNNWMRNLVLHILPYWKQQTKNNNIHVLASTWLKTVTSCSKFYINITHLNESESLITVMSELFFSEVFSPGHVIITTIIIAKLVFFSKKKFKVCTGWSYIFKWYQTNIRFITKRLPHVLFLEMNSVKAKITFSWSDPLSI